MYKNGQKFKVVKNGIICEITGVSTSGIYSMAFYENDELFFQGDVTQGTIENNIEYGFWKMED